MNDAELVSLKIQKRRQMAKITVFLLAVAVVTAGAFHLVHREMVEYRHGLQALAQGRLPDAVTHLEKAVAGGINVRQARVELGQAYLKLGRSKDALPVFEALAREVPGDHHFRDTVTGLYQAIGQPERGVALYRAQGSREKLDAADLVRLGDLHQHAGEFDDAIACYRLASERFANAEVFARLGIVLSWRGQRAEAERALARAIELSPQHRLARIYLARAEVQNGRFADAVENYRKVLSP